MSRFRISTQAAQDIENIWNYVAQNREFQLKKYPTNSCGWASSPPSLLDGRDAHPTRLDNLFVGVPIT
ncbi:hypothetical protein Cylst_1120 [Cylindrospermum stagnale PCC 7417]|uniref:Uncharacterized protein n=1 Tax=Cylindrospermum stagnale PCC 7417 TaxID=56107 RepID=K9WV79_9NOST|nr:hypothetical protein [Cylindrospermum stagnale]AFZ23427.1 hypothetical protein Cylst_1120 [Cylindrospermum stagnale PCC 7417]